MKNILLFLIINFFFFKLSVSYLIFPFKTRETQIKGSDKNITLFLRSLIDNHIFVNIEIGDPKQTIEVFLRTNSYTFFLSEKPKNDSEINPPNPMIYDVRSKIDNFFDQENSNTLTITNQSIYSSPGNVHLGNISYDYISLINNKNENMKIKIPFILYHTTTGNMPGVIGLKAIRSESNKEYNFFERLKLNDAIESYYWMINYTSNNEGNLIIGEPPHIFDPENYKENELFISHPFVHESLDNWGIKFDKINFNEKKIISNFPFFFNYEYNYIQGIDDLEKLLDIYFNESILNGICHKERINYPYAPRKFFYCDKDKYKNNIKYFPDLKLFNNELNYTFIMDYKDLFIEKYDKIVLMIFFDDYPYEWYLGKPFLRKYSFLINQDSKIVGFYKRDETKNKNSNDNDNIKNNEDYILLKIILIVIGIIILLSLGIFIGKYFYKGKTKKKNIIDEDYDYASKNDEIN